MDDQLSAVEAQFISAFAYELDGDPQAIMLAHECLSNTRVFVTSFHQFFNSMYVKLVAYGYSQKEVWRLTCILGMRIFRYLGEVRSGAKNPVTQEDDDDEVPTGQQLTTSSLWAVLRTQMRIKEFSAGKFHEHPVCTAEISSFMLQHLSFTQNTKNDVDITELKGEVTSLKSEVKGWKRVADHNQSELAELKKLVEVIKKKVN